MSDEITPWRVMCENHGPVCLTAEQYEAGLARPDDLWECPVSGCNGLSGWDDDWHDRAYQEAELVALFAEAMKRKLAKNRDKGGWENDSPEALLERLREEVDELAAAILGGPNGTPQHVLDEAADVANFAAMIADVVRAEYEVGGD